MSSMKINLQAQQEKLKDMLSERRYLHSVAVMETAVLLAQRYRADVEKTALAALLHDCGRSIPLEDVVTSAIDFDIQPDEIERRHPILLHAKVGAVLAQTEFGVTDADVIHAIQRHTVGGENLTKIAKILYLADMIEPGRDFEGVASLRQLAAQHLDAALLAAYEKSISFVLNRRMLLHPDTVAGRNELVVKLGAGAPCRGEFA